MIYPESLLSTSVLQWLRDPRAIFLLTESGLYRAEDRPRQSCDFESQLNVELNTAEHHDLRTPSSLLLWLKANREVATLMLLTLVSVISIEIGSKGLVRYQ